MLEIDGLSKTYENGVKALDGVTLSIAPGMFGLLGPNGAGKSTLMRTIATLQRPDSGSIRLDDLDVLADPAGLRSQLGYLPQEFGAYPRISAEKMLDHFATLKGFTETGPRRDLVNGLLESVNLWNDRKKSVDSYSGGMRQRFGIAQALIGDPRIVIVDEPTAGLDPEERARFLNLLAEIGEHVVVILSTHIVEDVSDLCSQMAIMNAGRIVATGSPADLVAELDGRVWEIAADRDLLAECQAQFNVVSTRLFAGRHVVHVVADSSPRDGFAAVAPDLSDLYFHTLRSAGAAVADEPAAA